jgi:hypothetical protein
MNIHTAIRLLQEACALHHTALSTEKSYVRCLRHLACFLQAPQSKRLARLVSPLKYYAALSKPGPTPVGSSPTSMSWAGLERAFKKNGRHLLESLAGGHSINKTRLQLIRLGAVPGLGWVHDRNTSEVSEPSTEEPEPGPRTQRQRNFVVTPTSKSN